MSTQTGQQSDFGANDWYIQELYEDYLKDPGSVGETWQEYFATHTPTTNGDSPAPDAAPVAAAPPAPSTAGSAASSPASSPTRTSSHCPRTTFYSGRFSS